MRINGLCLLMRDDGVQGWLALIAIVQPQRSTGQAVNTVPVGTETLPVL